MSDKPTEIGWYLVNRCQGCQSNFAYYWDGKLFKESDRDLAGDTGETFTNFRRLVVAEEPTGRVADSDGAG